MLIFCWRVLHVLNISFDRSSDDVRFVFDSRYFSGAGFSVSLPMILLGGLFEGTLLTVTPALCQPFMKQITGNDKVAMGHTGNIGYAASGFIGKVFGNKEKSTEDIKIPKSFGFKRLNHLNYDFDVDCLCDFGFAGWDRLCRA